jgi:hypothetical protein
MTLLRVGMLFVAGSQPNSVAAIENFRRLRESTHDCELRVEIVDVLCHYSLALEHGVLVTPCLVVLEPAPRVTIVGTLRDLDRVRAAMRLPPARRASP